MSVHSTAIVSAAASISEHAEIGAYCVIEGSVEIGAHTVVESHARIGSRFGSVVIGEHNYIQSGASLGGAPQDLGYQGGRTRLVVGHHNRIGEYATINLGSKKGEGVTRIGDRCFIMAYAHLGHDCQLADDVILTNGAQLAGHVSIGSKAIVGGVVGVTQFVRLGELCFVAAGAFANKDIPPYTIAEGHWAVPRAINRVGLRRAGIDDEEVRNIDNAVRTLLRTSLTVAEAIERIRAECSPSPQIERLLEFVTTSKKGIARA